MKVVFSLPDNSEHPVYNQQFIPPKDSDVILKGNGYTVKLICFNYDENKVTIFLEP